MLMSCCLRNFHIYHQIFDFSPIVSLCSIEY
ncbi:hypothetical protein LMG32289_05812 [Cupriavidus pampae]|uniref:Uncharacterized protein n=1 Tax=Cupriavidus pampae TaxID=659251 RepID=A0ABM8XX56_9BURK|nr:hypothetical protein LMG32289_05812 [Cupriavidus pampae]